MVRYNPPAGTLSENGWPMIDAKDTVSVQVIPAAKKVPLRKGDVATILNAFIILYHREVEPITSQVWGWSDDNDVATSNHMSGTAIDINAPKYPWGLRVMPADRIKKVRALLKKFEGVIFWGGEWSRPDEMHYQIGLPPSNPKVKEFAAKLNRGHLGAYGSVATDTPEVSMSEKLYLENIKTQLTGSPRLHEYPGWPQLGGRTLVDAVAAIGEKLGIDGMKAPKK